MATSPIEMRAPPLGLALCLAACSQSAPPGAPLPTSLWDDPAWRRDAGRVGLDLPAGDIPRVDAPTVDAPIVDAPAVDIPAVDAPTVDTGPCGAGLRRCGSVCVDVAISAQHCGACGYACSLPAARAACRAGTCHVEACTPGFADCDGDPANGCEVETATDPSACGACGRACPGAQVCAGGACLDRCPEGTTACGRACVLTASNALHCAACGRACAAPVGVVPQCRAGACGLLCASATADCNGDARDGCEVDTRADAAHCGRCGSRCAAGESCVEGACRAGCPAPFAACAGACRDLGTSATDCGRCGNRCGQGPHAAAICAEGACALRCEEGWADCDGDPANGCEASVRRASATCGRCGTVCMPGGACVNGTCQSGCPSGWSTCGGACVDATSDPDHCGACGRTCRPTPNTDARCVSGACRRLCLAGWDDCDGDASNGCETPVDRSPTNCGRCGNRCDGTVCSGGACRDTCALFLTACDGACVDAWRDLAHCGGCGVRCPARANAVAACDGGACRFRCLPGWDDCDGAAENGCETSLSTDQHCGRCGRACPTGLACADGTCVEGCPAGRERCGGTCADPQTDPRNCGGCGHACRDGQRCIEGACASTGAPRSCEGTDPLECTQVEVPGGTFRVGGDTSAVDASDSVVGLRVRRFAVDAYEVTVGRFRRFWAARSSALASIRATPVVYPGGHAIPWGEAAQPPGTAAGCTWTPTAGTPERERHPINCVDWSLAQEFCVWDGGRLPTEAEWEFVARAWVTAGLRADRAFPWGDHDPTQADLAAMMMPDLDAGQRCPYAHWSPCPGEDGRRTRRVGLGALGGPAGVFDLAGNVGEWTANSVASYGHGCWSVGVTDPLCVGTSELRVWRGGAYDAQMISELRGAGRHALFATQSAPTVGFRCARTR